MSRKMGARYEPHKAPSCHVEGLFSSSRFLGILLMALVLLLPTCSDACDAPPRYQSMMLKGRPNSVYQPGDRVEYQCRPGYILIVRIVSPLPASSVCRPDNTWEPLQEACKQRPCPQLGDPINGEVIYVNGTFHFGSQAHYVCNEGYYLTGTKILYCELSGATVEWSDSPPHCEKISCQPPGQIPNGRYSNSHKDTFEHNEVVIYSCNPSNGPDEYSLIGKRRLVCSGHNQWSSDPPECKVVKCQYPVLKNGRLVSVIGQNFYYTTVVTLECLQGFYLEGSSTLSCGANSTWEPKMPKCIKGVKPTVPTTPPTSSQPGVKPTVPTTPPTSSQPGVKPTVPTTPPTSSQPGVKPTVPTTPPASSQPGVKPTVPTTPPTSSQPGHSTLSNESPTDDNSLDGGLIAVIVLTVLLDIALVGACLYKYLYRRKTA